MKLPYKSEYKATLYFSNAKIKQTSFFFSSSFFIDKIEYAI
jgi:hypothetical protein